MSRSLQDLIAYAKTDAGKKKLRYAGVSLVFVPIGQILIQLLGYFVFDKNYTKAGIVSAAILTVPNFFANKIFVWRDTSKDKLRSQILVFWVAALLGTSLAALLTWLVEKAVDGQPTLIESGAVFLAQLVGFGIIWIARFLVLDRWLFKAANHGAEPSPDQLTELHADLPV